MKFRTIITTTVGAELIHDKPFDTKFAVLEYLQELLDYASIPLGESVDGAVTVTQIEVIEDEVSMMNEEVHDEQ